MAEDNQEVRSVFISYSWTSPEHVEWVVDLAKRLMSDGIDVVLDKWELTEGQDKYAFMEKMVTDKTINKVLAISDKRYAEKADGREGGVGTESQIISREVYEKVDQKKFIPIVTEDEGGIPCLPTFFKGRIYIDMSTPEKLHENYEKLIRNIYDKPLDKKPVLGKPPSYILDAEQIPSRTLYRLSMLKEAIMKDKGHLIRGLVSDFLMGYLEALEDYRVTWENNDPKYIEKTLSSIQSFLQYRDEFIDFLRLVSKYVTDGAMYDEIHHFFEDLLKYQDKPESFRHWSQYWADNYRFITYELFLYLITVLIKYKRFAEASMFMERRYYRASHQARPGKYQTYRQAFYANPETIKNLHTDFQSSFDQFSYTAVLLKDRTTHKDLDFHSLMQTDFILFVRSALHTTEGMFPAWFPLTFQYIEHYGPFELFIRAESSSFFEHLKILLNVKDKQDIEDKLDAVSNRKDVVMMNSLYETSIQRLMEFNHLKQFDTIP
jgi:hypothetical protein